MKCIEIEGIKLELTENQVRELKKQLDERKIRLSEIEPGELCEIEGYEFIVLEQMPSGAAVILSSLLCDNVEFRESGNNFEGSNVDKLCKEFENEFDKDIFITHTVDLTSDDGLKDYGIIERNVSLITAEQYRKYVEIIDKHKVDDWWWLATPHSTKTHNNDSWIKCVSPAGCINNRNYYNGRGVRPFCIFKSNIFVSKKGE